MPHKPANVAGQRKIVWPEPQPFILELEDAAQRYATFHVDDQRGMVAWYHECNHPITFNLPSIIVGEKSLAKIIAHEANFVALLQLLGDRGWVLQGTVSPAGTFTVAHKRKESSAE